MDPRPIYVAKLRSILLYSIYLKQLNSDNTTKRVAISYLIRKLTPKRDEFEGVSQPEMQNHGTT
jgi:hypothetical protein